MIRELVLAMAIVGLSASLNNVDARIERRGGIAIPQSIIEDVRKWASHPVTLVTLRAQNKKFADLTMAEIEDLDQQWRAETESAAKPLIAQLMGSPLSSYLTRIKAESLGLYTEIFVMDAKGLSVGQSSVTTDYWQGDEEKWLESFRDGPDGMVISGVTFHEPTQTRRVQVSLTIADPDSGDAIGAITVEIDLDELATR